MSAITFDIILFEVTEFINGLLAAFNAFAEDYQPWQLCLGSVLAYVGLIYLWNFLFQEESLFSRLKTGFFTLAKCIPYVRRKIDSEVNKAMIDIERSVIKHADGATIHKTLPPKRLAPDAIINHLSTLHALGDPEKRLREGKVSGTIYVGGQDYGKLTEVLAKTYSMFAWSNPLHPSVFPGVRQLESEVISMVCQLFGGDQVPTVCGSMTSGGTESILMALKSYREWARETKGITNPNIVVCRTAHPAFDKACEYFNIVIRKVPEDPVTRRAVPSKMKKAIDSNTICIVGSCVNYPYGSADPIAELSDLALKKGVGLHVDCCLGSFVVAFMRKAGYEFPDFDFRLPGVTSISADTHKYGFCPKGSSLVMYRTPQLRRYQYSVFPNWPGGIYGTPAMAGSRPGALVAATWAAVMFHGAEGYAANTKLMVEATRKIANAIKKINGIKLCCEPDTTVISFTSDVFDINRILTPLSEQRHWDLNMLQFPAAAHICITMAHTPPGVAESFIRDLEVSVAELMKDPKKKADGAAAMYGTTQAIPDRSIIKEIVHSFLDTTYKVEKTAEHSG